MPKNILILLALLFPALAIAQTKPDSTKIAEINRLGTMLYQYDQAAWHGTDAIIPLMVEIENLSELIQGFVVKQTESGWSKAFGRIEKSDKEHAFYIVFEAFLDENFREISSHYYEDNRIDIGFYRDAMRARNIAAKRFEPNEEVPFNTAVIPANDDLFYVYFMPAQPAINVHYVGGDVRFTYSVSQDSIVDTKVLHQRILAVDLRDDNVSASISTGVLYDHPVETDVFFAISRRPISGTNLRHIVMTETWIYMLGPNGIFDYIDREEYFSREID